VLADVPAEVVGKLEPLLGRIETVVVGCRTHRGAVYRDAELTRRRRDQFRIIRIVEAILKPAKTRLIHHRAAGNGGPGESAVAIADGGIGVIGIRVVIGQHRLGLNAVWRDPVHVVQAGTDRIARVQLVIDLAEQHVGVRRSGQQHVVPAHDVVASRVALRLSDLRGTGGIENARAGGETGIDDPVQNREVTTSDFAVEEVE